MPLLNRSNKLFRHNWTDKRFFAAVGCAAAAELLRPLILVRCFALWWKWKASPRS